MNRTTTQATGKTIRRPLKKTVRLHSAKKEISPSTKKLLEIAGCLSDEDAAELKAIIEDACERIEIE